MSDASIAAITAGTAGGLTSAAPLQPTAQQTARFEQQLQLADTPTHYGMPLAESDGMASNVRAIVDYVEQANMRLTTGPAGPPAQQMDLTGLGPEQQQQLQLQRQISNDLLNMNNATLQFEVVGKSVELAENLPKVLYQQG